MEAMVVSPYHEMYEMGLNTVDSFKKYLGTLDLIIANKSYLVGGNRTLADLSILCTLTTTELIDFDLKPYANVFRWINGLKNELPYYTELVSDKIKDFKPEFDRCKQPETVQKMMKLVKENKW